MKTAIIVDFKLIFDEEKYSLETYLRGINRNDLLSYIPFFLGFKNHNSEYSHYEDFLNMFFCNQNEQLKNTIIEKIKTIDDGNKEFLIVNSDTSLILFEYCYDNIQEETTKRLTQPEIEVNLFKAYLLLNEFFTTKEQLAFSTTRNLPVEIKYSCMHLAQSFPYSSLVNYQGGKIIVGQIIKAIFLFEYLESSEKTKLLLQSFLNYYKVSYWKDYIKRLLPIVIYALDKENESHVTIEASTSQDVEFLDNLAIKDISSITDIDFIKLRNQPLLKTSENKYVIIYDLFLFEKLYKGLYFKLKEINETLEESIQISNFKSLYGGISEQIMLYKIMESICSDKFIKRTGQEMKIKGATDYYIRDVENIFLFESKDFLILAEIKRSHDFNEYEKVLKERLFYAEKEDGSISKKAIKQLFYNIELVINKKFPFDQEYNINDIYIYPIIIIHDYQYNIAGLNNLINYWAKDELITLKNKGITVDRIKPITIIDMDTLIYHQDLLRDKIKLNEVLDSYFDYITIDNNKSYTDQEYSIAMNQSIYPFSTFLDLYVGSDNIKIPEMLSEKGFSLF